MIQEVLTDADSRMSKAMDALNRDLSSVRTGRANPSLLDRVSVEYYGTSSPLNQLAGISVPEPRMLVITPWDQGSIPAIEKAIMKSDVGITPNSDGKIIRLALPPLT
ncbi:MAG: ribosome-recycling factor, partial [Thermomicrobiales bacterium]